MAPSRSSGQLDEISEAIGRLEGRFEGLDRYTHEREHNIANLRQEVNAIAALVSKEVAAAEAKITARVEAIDGRLLVLEKNRSREEGAKGVLLWILQSPLVGWIAAAIMFVTAWWRGQVRL